MKFREKDIKMMTTRLTVDEILERINNFEGKHARCDSAYVPYIPLEVRPRVDIFQFIDDINEVLR